MNMGKASLVVYRDDERVFAGEPLDKNGGFRMEIPDPVRGYLVSAWDYWHNDYADDFGKFWAGYVCRRIGTNMNLLMQGYSVDARWE